jgi:hypothetical protein
MKALYALVLAAVLTGCAGMKAHVEITKTHPSGVVETCVVDSARRTAVSCAGATVITGQVLINDATVQVLGKAAASIVLPLESLKPTRIGIFKIQPTIPYPELSQQQVDVRAKQVEDYYRTLAGHKWDVKVTGYVVRANCNTSAPIYCKTEVAEYLKANHPEMEFDYYHVWGGGNNVCGLGNVGGNWSGTYIRYGCPGERTTIHELGHNFGLRHSDIHGSHDASDKTGIMGALTADITFPVSAHLDIMGLEKSIEVVTESKEVIVPTVESFNLVKVGKYYLSLRKDKGHIYPVEGSGRALYIHYLDGSKSKRLAAMRVGSTRQLAGGIKLEYLEYSDERARVAVTIGDVPPEGTIMPDYIEQEAPITAEHSGGWYHRDFDGQGFDIQVKGDTAAIYWYTFNQGDTARRFYFGACDIADCRFDLYTTEGSLEIGNGGTYDITPSSREYKIGEAQLYPQGDKLVFKYNTDEHGVGLIENELIARGEVLGSYYDPEHPGEGFSIQMYGDTMVAYWYTYGKSEGDSAKAVQTQRWYLCAGEAVKGSEGIYHLKVYEVQGGMWMQYDKTPIVEVDRATMTPVGDGWEFETKTRRIPLTLLF